MKQPYLYFGRKGYYAFPAIANGDHTGTPVTNVNGFMVPANKAVSVDASEYLQLSHRAVDAGTNTRSAIVIANGPRPGTPAFTGGNDLANIVAGEVSILDNKEALLVESTGQLTVTLVGTDGGLTATANDFLYLEEIKFNANVGPYNDATADICLPASNFISAQPVAYTAAGGVHWDLAAQDKTRLIFKSLHGSGDGVTTINIIHTAGKYKEICEAMQDLCNSSVYDEMVKVHYLDIGGQHVHNAFSSRGITIYGMNIIK